MHPEQPIVEIPFTHIRLVPGPLGPSRIKAFASVRWAGVTLKGLKIIEGENGLFVSTPAERHNGRWYPHYVFESKPQLATLEQAILEEYHRVTTAPAVPVQ
ncbi:MAG: septation protein SpoVG family protein [Candidatus Xenobia bacterium]